jgi:MFS transporter, ACS family, allantoate permease
VCWCLGLADLVFLYAWCRWQNKKKADIRAQPGYQKLDGQEFYDLTDRENPELVYTRE